MPRRPVPPPGRSPTLTAAGDYPATGAEEARNAFPSLVNAAMEGRPTYITRHGRKVAAIVPAAHLEAPRQAPLCPLAGSGKGLWGRRSRARLKRLRDEWDR